MTARTAVAAPPPGLSITGQRDARAAAYWGRRFVAVSLVAWAASPAVGLRASLAVIVALGFAAAIAGIRQPALGLLGITVLCTVEPAMNTQLFTGGLLRWNTFNYWLLIVLLLFTPLAVALRDPHSRLLRLFLLVLVVQLLISPDVPKGIQNVLEVLSFFGLYIYFARAGVQRDLWAWMGLVSGTVAAAGGLAFLALGSKLPTENPNAWAFFPLSALFMLALASPFASRSRGSQIAMGLLAAVNLGWVFLSGSRGSLLTGTACVFLLVLESRGGPRATVVASVALVGVAASALFGDLQARTTQRLRLLIDPHASVDDRTSGRSALLVGGWYMFRQHPFGVGTGGFAMSWLELDRIEGMSEWGRGTEKDAHAGWVKALAENGVVGSALMVAFVTSFGVVGWRRRRHRRALMVGLLATWSLALGFITTEYQNKALWFLAAGAATLLHADRIARLLHPGKGPGV